MIYLFQATPDAIERHPHNLLTTAVVESKYDPDQTLKWLINDEGLGEAMPEECTIMSCYNVQILHPQDDYHRDNCHVYTSSIRKNPGIVLANDVLPADVAHACDADDDGPCTVCKLHDDTYTIFSELEKLYNDDTPVLCPYCGRPVPVESGVFAVVGEVNFYNPTQKIGKYATYVCPHCEKDGKDRRFALMPIPIEYNANHDIYYTGGKSYIVTEYESDSAIHEFKLIFSKHVWPSIKQYVTRKIYPTTGFDQQLTEDNLELWTSLDFNQALCEFLYNHGLKK